MRNPVLKIAGLVLWAWVVVVGASLAPSARAAEGAEGSYLAEGSLYNVGVDVASRSLSDRRAGAAEGLSVMLTRLSGLTTVPNSAAVRRARSNPERYYSQYRYLGTDRFDELGQPLTTLNLQFSAPAMRSLMLEAQLPLWTLNRPKLAVWLVEEAAGSTDIIEDPEHPLLAATLGRAEYRGLPALTPGSARLNTRDIVGRKFSALKQVATLNDADLMLLGRAEQLGPEEWRVRWTSWAGGSSASAKTTNLSGSPAAASARAVDNLVNALVNQFTVAGGEAGTLELVIENITAVDDYARLLKYLSSRSYVENVNVAGLAGDELTVLVSTTGTSEKFVQLLAIDSRLVESTRRSNARLPQGGSGRLPRVDTESGDKTQYGSRSAISVPVIADERLRMAWQG